MSLADAGGDEAAESLDGAGRDVSDAQSRKSIHAHVQKPYSRKHNKYVALERLLVSVRDQGQTIGPRARLF